MIARSAVARLALLAAAALALAACAGSRNSLGDIAPVSRIEVRPRDGKSAPWVITDRAAIDSVVHFVATSRGWNDVLDTPAAGEWSVGLMRDSTLVAAVRIGSQFVETQGYQPPDRVQSLRLTAAQSDALRAWLGIPR